MSDNNDEIAKALVTMLNEKKAKSQIDALLHSLTGDEEPRQDWRGSGGKRGKAMEARAPARAEPAMAALLAMAASVLV